MSSGENNSIGRARIGAVFAASFVLVFLVAYSSTLKMQPIYSFETVDCHRATWRYISQIRSLYSLHISPLFVWSTSVKGTDRSYKLRGQYSKALEDIEWDIENRNL
jgi:hypothetical protein